MSEAPAYRNIQWTEAPSFATGAPRRGSAQARGLAYERKLARFLSICHRPQCGRWLSYEDLGGRRFAQPDILVRLGTFSQEDERPLSSKILLLEAKLSLTADAWPQLQLYQKLLQALYPEDEIVPVQVCKHLVAGVCGPQGQAIDLIYSLEQARPWTVWQWLGRGRVPAKVPSFHL